MKTENNKYQLDNPSFFRRSYEVGRKGLALAGVVAVATGSAATIANAKGGREYLANKTYASERAKPVPREWFALSKKVIEAEKKSTKPHLFYGAMEMDGFVEGTKDHALIYLNLLEKIVPANQPGEHPIGEVHPGKILVEDCLIKDVGNRTYAIVYDRGPVYSELYYKDSNSSQSSADTSWPNLITFRYVDLTKAQKYGHLRYYSHSNIKPQMARTFVKANNFFVKDSLPPWGIPLEFAYQAGTPHTVGEYIAANSLKALPPSYQPPFKILGG